MQRDQQDERPDAPANGPAITLFGRRFNMPRSRLARISAGVGLLFLGLFGFLPILGFWMIPAGLLVLSFDIPAVRRWRRRLAVMWGNRFNGRAGRPRGRRESRAE